MSRPRRQHHRTKNYFITSLRYMNTHIFRKTFFLNTQLLKRDHLSSNTRQVILLKTGFKEIRNILDRKEESQDKMVRSTSKK